MTETLQAIAIAFTAVAGAAVVGVRDLFRQAIVVSLYGLLLVVLFLVYQAPDVSLSALVVGAVALPLMLLLALAKIRSER